MPIIRSVIINQTIQADNTKRVYVYFEDHLQIIHTRNYDFPNSSIVADEIETRKVNVENGLKNTEIEQVCSEIEKGDTMPVLKYATMADVKTELLINKTDYETEITDLENKNINIEKEIK